MVHGNDYLCTGKDQKVKQIIEKMQGIFEVEVTVVWPEGSLQKELVMMDRRVR